MDPAEHFISKICYRIFMNPVFSYILKHSAILSSQEPFHHDSTIILKYAEENGKPLQTDQI